MDNTPKNENPEQDSEPNQYTVGYGKPPIYSQFKPGQSGNPKGRPRGAKSLATILNAALNEKVTVNKNGKKIKKTKVAVAIEQLVNKAVAGDLKALAQLTPHLLRADEVANKAKSENEPDLGDADSLVLTSILARIRSTVSPDDYT